MVYAAGHVLVGLTGDGDWNTLVLVPCRVKMVSDSDAFRRYRPVGRLAGRPSTVWKNSEGTLEKVRPILRWRKCTFAEAISYVAIKYYDLRQQLTNYKFTYDQMLIPKEHGRVLVVSRASGKYHVEDKADFSDVEEL
jgi:hypothetical protein